MVRRAGRAADADCGLVGMSARAYTAIKQNCCGVVFCGILRYYRGNMESGYIKICRAVRKKNEKGKICMRKFKARIICVLMVCLLVISVAPTMLFADNSRHLTPLQAALVSAVTASDSNPEIPQNPTANNLTVQELNGLRRFNQNGLNWANMHSERTEMPVVQRIVVERMLARAAEVGPSGAIVENLTPLQLALLGAISHGNENNNALTASELSGLRRFNVRGLNWANPMFLAERNSFPLGQFVVVERMLYSAGLIDSFYPFNPGFSPDAFNISMSAVETANNTLTLTINTEFLAHTHGGAAGLDFTVNFDADKLSIREPRATVFTNFFGGANPRILSGHNACTVTSAIEYPTEDSVRIRGANENVWDNMRAWYGNIAEIVFDIKSGATSGDEFGFFISDVYAECWFEYSELGAVSVPLTHTFTGSGADAPTITTIFLQNGSVNSDYNQTLTADGTAPITWTVVSGNLPNDLTLDQNTGEITGTPSLDGTFTFTVRAQNSAGNHEKEFSVNIVVAVPPTGITDITGYLLAMLALFAASVALFSYRKKLIKE
jgi:hypothetical protein